MSNRLTNIIAFLLIIIMFALALIGMKGDSLTFDELAHIPAGYSYLTQRDYRINPEHPPLVKDLAALPLLFLHLNFPSQSSNWTQENSPPAWWVQFDLGTDFIYHSGNNPRTIIFFARLPMILLLVLLAWLLFYWAKKLGGNYVGLAVLTLFAFSPNFLANGRLVTTDIGATLGAIFATFFWLKFLEKPNWLNVLMAGITFGLAMLLKFSLVLLIPFFGLITIIFPLLFYKPFKEKLKNLFLYLVKGVLAGLIGVIVIIYPIYSFHISNYPMDHQIRDTAADLAPNEIKIPAFLTGGKVLMLKDFITNMARTPILRPLSQYFRGVMMAQQRTAFGNSVYFLGNISGTGWHYYFPIMYLVKEPLAIHIMILLVLIGSLILFFRKRIYRRTTDWLRNNFTIFSLALFVLIYWLTAILGNLNIGVRHILPTFAFIYLLVILGVKKVIGNLNSPQLKKVAVGAGILLFLWYIISSLSVFPNYLSYYNELAGGAKNGYKIAVDSNYDWGQDFYRLLDFVKKNNIDKIYVDYFGGENAQYWLGDKYIKFDPTQMKTPPKGWIAISANSLQGGRAVAIGNYSQSSTYYEWLDNYKPVARIGYSIFVYKIE